MKTPHYNLPPTRYLISKRYTGRRRKRVGSYYTFEKFCTHAFVGIMAMGTLLVLLALR